jgi:hypothetical protein
MNQSPKSNGEKFFIQSQGSLRVGDTHQTKELYFLSVLLLENKALKGSEI